MVPAIVLAIFVFSMPGQRGAAPAPTQQQPPAGQKPSTASTSTTQPATAANNTTNNVPSNPTSIFITGDVMLSDGTPAPPNAQVRVVCGMRALKSEYADPRGNFSIIIGGQSSGLDSDSVFGQGSTSNVSNLFGCEVRASLAGYISNSIPLDRHSSLDNPDVGTIYLHRIGEGVADGEGEGYVVSITTKLAPKDARREFEKGLASVKAKKLSEAEQEFLKAVMIYPKYALAWYELGRVYDQEKKFDDALHAQQQAIQIEPKFVSPYSELSVLVFRQQKWPDVLHYSSEHIKLSAYSSPAVYFYNAAANYNLHQIDAAEKSARTAARLDPKHRVPQVNHLLGLILEQKKDFKGALENLNLYLQLSPAATDAAEVRERVANLEKASSGQ
jgi:tetratricopeptide (TPR) repeat protein